MARAANRVELELDLEAFGVTALQPVPAPPPVSRAALDAVRDQLAPGASDVELDLFARVCNRLELDPFADQIVLIGRYDKRVKRDVFRHQVTVAGRRALATRTGRLAGIEGPVWCGRREDNGGELRWVEVWEDDENPPYCARALVHVHGWVVPANGTAKWSEFSQWKGDGSGLLPTWAAMPSHMLGKCAESMALRRAFPDVLTGAVVDGFASTVDPDAVELEDVDAERVALERRAAYAATSPAPDPPVEVEDPLASSSPVTPTHSGSPSTSTSRPGARPGDQSTAHRRASMLGDRDLAAFLDRHAIGDFGDVWPPAAVAEMLEDGD